MRRSLLSAAIASCFAGAVFANPSGPAVVSGGASFAASGRTLTVTNTPGAIINWQQFSIQKDELTRFIQQGASSAVLNRVIGQDPSAILGRLSSNGRVFLVNPNGIVFGAGSVIDVAGFAASTLNISDSDWIAGRLRFAGSGAEGAVKNAGTIKTADGGFVYLIAPNVENQSGAVISSPQGEIVIAAGRTVELVNAHTPEIRVEFTAPDNQAVNAGEIVASSGRIGIYGTVLKNSGLISAGRAEVGDGGKIVLKAVKDATLGATGRILASGAKGGSVTVQGETGALLAEGAIEARGEEGKGGEIQLLAKNVGLLGSASVDASGDTGGGVVLVGGDRHGDNPDVQNAWRTYVGPDATVRADAITSGDGGKVIVWADDTTRAYGTITAKGGAQSGDGGFVEVSGRNFLDFSARVDASAPKGEFGTLLLDPTDIVVATSGAAAVTDVDRFSDPGTTLTISPSALNGAAATVVLQATNDITVSSPVSLTTLGAGFVAQAGRNVTVDVTPNNADGIVTNGGRIHLEADSLHSSVGAGDGSGVVSIKSPIRSWQSDPATGGHVTLIGGGNSQPNGGGFTLAKTVDAGAGGIDVAVTSGGSLTFFIGAGGNTQFSSNDTGDLRTTGALVLGRATTGGPDGAGTPVTGNPATGAVVITADGIVNETGSGITISPSSAGSFQLVAGTGGITINQPLTTSQSTTITTTGTFELNATLNTSGSDLVIDATTVNLSGGSVNTGGGVFGCSGSGCPSGTSPVNQWNVDANGDWFLTSNWSLGHAPTSSEVALIDRPAGLFTIGLGSAGSPASTSVGLLVNSEILNITGNATTKSQLDISSALLHNSSSASSNTGTLALNNAILGGSGTLANSGSVTLTSAAVNASLDQSAGTLVVAGANTVGRLTLNGGTATVSSGADLSIGTLTFGGSLASGALGGTGNLTVSTDFLGTTGGFGSSFANLSLTKLGNFSAGALQASQNLTLTTTNNGNLTIGGALSADKVTLVAGGTGNAVLDTGSSVTATGTGDSIVISGTNFTNNVGGSVLTVPGGGRWLVYSTSPANSTENGLTAAADPSMPRLYGRSYPAAIPESGSHLIYSAQPILTATADDKSKTYGGVDPTLAYSISGFINDDGVQDTVITAGLSGAPLLSTQTGASATAGTHTITASQGSLASGAGYSIATANGTLSVAKAAALTATADDKAKTYGGADPALTYTVGGTLFYSDTAAVVSGVSLVTNTGAAATAGTHTIAASGGTAANYNVTTANGTLSVAKAVVNLTGNRTYDGSTNFGPDSFGTVNGVYGETLGVASGVGTVASPKVLAGTQSLAPGSLALGNGTGSASNYTLVGGAHTGTITASLTVPFGWDVTATDLRWDNAANWNQGAVPLNGAVASIPSGLTGPVVYSSASGVTDLRTLTSGSGLTITGGTLNLSGTGTDSSTFSGFPLTLAGGTLGGGGTLNVATSLEVLSGGVLGGSRLIVGNVNNTGGTVAPGASPGILTINGNYTQGSSGTLAIELGGAIAGTQYDRLVVTGNASLGGTLGVTLVNGYLPTDGTRFSVVQCGGTLSGTFASTVFPAASIYMATYLASGVDVTAGLFTPPPLPIALINNSPPPPPTALTFEGGSSGSGSQVQTTAYLETSTGQTLALEPVSSSQTGVYVNVETGQLIKLSPDLTLPPGIYLSDDSSKVLVVTVDEVTGQRIVMTALTGGFPGLTIGPNAKVKKLAVCN